MANELTSANAETEIVEKESLLSTTVGDYQCNNSFEKHSKRYI